VAREQIQTIGLSTAAPADVWRIARDFCGCWHPAIATMVAERSSQGHLIRAFTVQGETKTYRERLTYFSDTDMTLAYTHLEGIEGVESYTARLRISARDLGGSVICMSAGLEAPAARATEIAAGTEVIFKEGVAALAAAAAAAPAPEARALALDEPVESTRKLIDTLPRLALQITPDRDGPLCLFLHGIGGSRLNWQRQLGQIGRMTRAAALDLRGYGESELGPIQSSVDDYCDDILRVAEVCGAGRLILVGLSYGSWIATSFAMRHADRLAGLVLSGGCTGMSEALTSEREAFRISREVPLSAGQIPADFAPAVVRAIAGPAASAAIREELRATMAAIPAATYRDALRCFTNPLERFDFSKLTMPVLLMSGEFDQLAPPAEIKAVAEQIFDASPAPDVRFEVIAGVGHVCNVEGAEAYTRHLSEFVAGLVG
jgi:pimeloyl-ACP methyl ester carboxylesterase